MYIYHSHTKKQNVLWTLYHPDKKIPCVLIKHYGHHRPNSDYKYCYRIEIVPI